MNYSIRLANERERLKRRHASGTYPSGVIISYDVHCDSNAEDVLDRVINVMIVVNENCNRDPALNRDEWVALLPRWFVGKCAPEWTQAEAQEHQEWWRKATDGERADYARVHRSWSLNNFTYWFEDEGLRTWFWWEARITGPATFLLSIEVDGHPFAMGALKWLLNAAGATSITEHIRAWGEKE